MHFRQIQNFAVPTIYKSSVETCAWVCCIGPGESQYYIFFSLHIGTLHGEWFLGLNIIYAKRTNFSPPCPYKRKWKGAWPLRNQIWSKSFRLLWGKWTISVNSGKTAQVSVALKWLEGKKGGLRLNRKSCLEITGLRATDTENELP